MELEWLFARQRFMQPGLDRIRALLADLDHPETSFRSILITGTNGKGSTAASLASILQEASYRTALFTSPHLSYFRERFNVDGAALPDKHIAAALKRIQPLAQKHSASFFEIVTALACDLFAEAKVDYAVMECGMGGRYDATNALEPVLSIITNVALDHQQYLGDSLEAIARDKAGIMRPQIPSLTAASGVALTVLQEQARAVGSALASVHPVQKDSILGDYRYEVSETGWHGTEFILQTPALALTLHTALLGEHQAANAAVAAAAAQTLGIAESQLRTGLAKTRWPGRLELLSYRGKTILLDGAHNPAGASALHKALKALGLRELTLIFGATQDKDAPSMLNTLLPLTKRVILTRSQHSPRALAPETLGSFIDKAEVVHDAAEALNMAVLDSDVIVIAGSLFLIGELRPLILGMATEELERWQ